MQQTLFITTLKSWRRSVRIKDSYLILGQSGLYEVPATKIKEKKWKQRRRLEGRKQARKDERRESVCERKKSRQEENTRVYNKEWRVINCLSPGTHTRLSHAHIPLLAWVSFPPQGHYHFRGLWLIFLWLQKAKPETVLFLISLTEFFPDN